MGTRLTMAEATPASETGTCTSKMGWDSGAMPTMVPPRALTSVALLRIAWRVSSSGTSRGRERRSLLARARTQGRTLGVPRRVAAGAGGAGGAADGKLGTGAPTLAGARWAGVVGGG